MVLGWETYKIKVENRFIYFASPIAGGTAGNSYIQYFCIDLQNEKIISVTYECPDGTGNCDFEDLTPIKEDSEVFKFMMANIRMPEGDNYFETK